MTYVYGATLRGTARHIEEKIATDHPEIQFPDGANTYGYCLYMARKLFEGIASTVPAAEAGMQWLRGVTKQMSGKPLLWRTPVGFPVVQEYPNMDASRVFIRSCGQSSVLAYNITEGANPQKMRNSVSPNFVHSLDAAHLVRTADKMRESGCDMVGIHDSFGTHACDVRVLHENVREAFVEMYEHRNVLAEFLCSVGGVGETPARGTLDISLVRDSEFFFC